jgi:hypothetical protein
MSKNPSHANNPLIASGKGFEQHKAIKFILAKILIIDRRKICCYSVRTVQGGSDKSGILIWFFKNDTAHLKTIRFH